jgi:hypothetical protein
MFVTEPHGRAFAFAGVSCSQPGFGVKKRETGEAPFPLFACVVVAAMAQNGMEAQHYM